MGEKTLPCSDWTYGQVVALIKKIGGEDVARAILRGELKLTRRPMRAEEAGAEEATEAEIAEAVRAAFDKNGRRIPRGLKSRVLDANRKFHLVQPDQMDCAVVLARLQQHFPEGTPFVPIKELGKSHREMLEEVRGDQQIANLLKGVCLPLPLPQVVLAKGEQFDYGRVLEQRFVAAAKASYEAEFPGRTFHDHRKGQLEGRVSVIDGSRHNRLVERLVQGPACGLWFPNPLQGFSILADREQLAELPENLLLCGGFDTLTGVAAYPGVVGRGYQTPGLDMAAVSWRSAARSLYFSALAFYASFDVTASLAGAGDYCSGGLLFVR